MTSPDDLPRSPSGRIPQWVLDEAAGRTVESPAWRTDVAYPEARGSRRAARRARRAARRAAGPSNRVTVLIAVLVVATTLAASLAWVDDQPGGLAGAWASLRGEDVVVDDPSRPPVGLGEAAAPLGTPPEVPASTSYAFVATQAADTGEQVPVTWSPCRPIHFVINVDRAPDDFIPTVGAVVEEVSAATGLDFVFDGLSDEPPVARRASYLPQRYGDQWAPVLVQFADELDNPELAGDVAGVGGPAFVADPTTGTQSYVSGSVQLDVTQLDEPDAGTEPAYVPVLRHELGHVIGLQHVTDDAQIMFPTTNDVRDYQDGDRAGLALLGAGPCAPGL
ncbi:matrixin family metalloprotease [Cellulomonas rhizosphaerae]|uniref:matrixin family metalloprotease n=1 Tax=Cellulomonas rhizosphaerae TaxID=2293719 RepID=UPI0013149BD0|nr:matrixin family metalloprotease [Cellulomonas rhizosphaerae]